MPKIDTDAQAARREHILDAAEQCFAERGFHSSSMHDICRAAAVSPGALYTYFSSKEQLIAGICDREKSKLVDGLAAVAQAEDFMAALAALGDTYCVEQPQAKMRLHVEMNAEALRNPAIGEIVRSVDAFVLHSFERLLIAAKDEGRINPSVDTKALAQVLTLIGDGLCLQRAMNQDFDAAVVMPIVMELLSSLLQPTEERAKYAMKSSDASMGSSMKTKTGAAILAVLLAMGVAGRPLMAQAADAPPAAAAQVPAVSVAATAKTPFTESVLVTGSLTARLEVLISPQIEGYRITELLVDEGDRVAEGQVLARLHKSTLEAQLAQLEAQQVRADAAIAQAHSNIAQTEANQKQTAAAFERAQDLVKSGATSRATFDEREAAARTAAASVTSAQDGLRVSEADKTQILAQIRESKLRLGYTDIIAPTAGLVSRRNAKLGAVAAAVGDPLFRIIAKGEVEMEAEVPEIYLPKIAGGMSARIEVAGLRERSGTIRLISPEVDRATRLGRVRIFIGDDKELRVGTFARAVITVAKSDGLGVPSSALLTQNDAQTVQVVKDGKVETRSVRTGLVSAGKTEIVDGLAEGELVVTRSGTLLRDGDAVRPVLSEKTAASEVK